MDINDGVWVEAIFGATGLMALFCVLSIVAILLVLISTILDTLTVCIGICQTICELIYSNIRRKNSHSMMEDN